MLPIGIPLRRPHKQREPATLAADVCRRVYLRTLKAYGVRCFDEPTFHALYPFRARVILETARNLRSQGF